LQQFLAVSSLPEQQPFIPFLSQLPPQQADAFWSFPHLSLLQASLQQEEPAWSWLEFMLQIASWSEAISLPSLASML
jgi:hypothetical protein